MKKFKLFTTIASLCLAVALMAFGVYAATNASIGVKSNITFTVSGNVGGTLTVKSYSVASANAEITASNTVLENFEAEINATDASGNVDATKGDDEEATFDINNKYVVYVIKFVETTNENVTLQVSNVTLKKVGTETATETEEIKVVTNELTNSVSAKVENAVKEYKIVVQLAANLNADAEYEVSFAVAVAPANN